MKATDFEILLSIVLYLTRNWCITFEESEMKYVAGLVFCLTTFNHFVVIDTVNVDSWDPEV